MKMLNKIIRYNCNASLHIYANLESNQLIAQNCCQEDTRYKKSFNLDQIDEFLSYYLDEKYKLIDRFYLYHEDKCIYPKDTLNNFGSIDLKTITQCNFNCPNCTRRFRNNAKYKKLEEELTIELIKKSSKYINKTIELGLNCEISLYPNLLNCINSSKNEFHLFSNGSNLDYLKQITAKVTSYTISLHSMNENAFDTITRTHNYMNKVIETINWLHDTKKHLIVSIVIFEENKNEIDSLIKYLRNKKIKFQLNNNTFSNERIDILRYFKYSDSIWNYGDCYDIIFY